jgi:CTP synthase
MSNHGLPWRNRRNPNTPAYIFVSGGVLSSLGKGTTTASIALLLKSRGYRVSIVKCENYLNIDAGLINPIEHGDAFLCEDGTEADMDLGTYEKHLHQDMHRHNFVTMGQVYKAVIDRERAFGYNGEDVEAMPHVTDEIISRINDAAKKDNAEIVIIELGGTAGEYQNILYYEASRILDYQEGNRVVHVHVSYLPTPEHIGEPKTKPTQLSIKHLNSMGIQPDFIVGRATKPMDERRRERLGLFCHVRQDHVIDSPDVESVYEIPLLFAEQEFDVKLLNQLDLPPKKLNIKDWENLVERIKQPKKNVARIGIIGKYFATGDYELRDSYAALIDAIRHAEIDRNCEAEVVWINSEELEKVKDPATVLSELDGIIVPIGWGARGVEGKIRGIQYARENKVPYLGLCYGMQLAVVEFARNVVGWKDAHTQEVDPDSKHQIIHIIPEQQRILKDRAYGGTMRLGKWDCKLKEGTQTLEIYEKADAMVSKKDHVIAERHRHRYEGNDEFIPQIEKAGLTIAGRSIKENLVEFIELPKKDHPFFIGTQGHPEYKSRPLEPHPLFVAFLQAAIENSRPSSK